MTLVLWGRMNSVNVQKVAWALEELGLPWRRERVGGTFGGVDAPAYRALNPNGLVPVLQDGALTLFESDAIVRHLARTRGAGALRPDDLAAQALADQWMTWAGATLFPAINPIFFATCRKPRAEQDVSGLGEARAKLQAAAGVLDARLARHPYVAGEAFSFGDIGAGVLARRALLLPWGAPEAPHVAAWVERLRARRAFRETVDRVPLASCLEDWREIEAAHG